MNMPNHVDEIPQNSNIAAYLPFMAEKYPYTRAVVFPQGRDHQGRVSYTHYTFAQLERHSNLLAHGILSTGLKPGERVIVLVPPSMEFVVLSFALMKTGIVPVMIDPGMGIQRMVSCIGEVTPTGFFGCPKAHVARMIFPKYFTTVRVNVTVGKRYGWGGTTLEALASSKENEPFEMHRPKEGEPSAIFFTTGSTGAPKGVVYTHSMMHAQVRTIRTFFDIQPGEVDLPAFPLFVLFSTAFGITAVIPDMDPTRPAQVNPIKIIEAIEDHGVTNTFGSPAIWERVSAYCIEKGIKLPSMKRILIAGAPVPGRVLKRFQEILPAGDAYTPYGATEALPLTSIAGKEICSETDALTGQGKGVCVGKILPGATVKIIRITDEAILLDEKGISAHLSPPGEVGEIIAQGSYVTREYFARENDNQKSKIVDGDAFWHRMGDLGYFDEKERLWVVGRKAHRVCRGGKTMFSLMTEAPFNRQKDVFRAALVGVPDAQLGQKAVIIIEPVPGKMPGAKDAKKWAQELLTLARESHLEIDHVLFHPSFPVDIRHNAKIRREVLSEWAAKEMGIK